MNRKLKTLFKTVSYVYKQNPLYCGLRDVAFVLQTAIDMYAITVGGRFIDATSEILVSWVEFDLYDYFFTSSFQFLLGFLLLWIFSNLLGNSRNFFMEKIRADVELQAGHEVMEKISKQNLQEVEQIRFQQLITFVPSYSITRIFSVYNNFSEILRFSIRLVSALAIAYRTMGLSVLYLIVISIAEPVMLYIGDSRIRAFRKKEVDGVKMCNYYMDTAVQVSFFSELRVDGVFKFLKKSYRDGNQSFISGMVALFRRSTVENGFWATLGQVLLNLYYVYIIAISVSKRLTIGDFKALYDYSGIGYNSSYWLMRSIFTVSDQLSYTDEFFELIEYDGFGDLDTGDEKLKRGVPRLEFKDLGFAYPDGLQSKSGKVKKALEGINALIEPGEKIAFVGTDGSGKSSLVKVLCGLYEIKSGDYKVNEHSIRELARGELKNRTSVVFQDFVRYNFTLKQNIAIANDKTLFNKSRYDTAKRIAGVDVFMEREGLKDNQVLGKFFPGGREISPGYWQRLAIARMLYRHKDINIMDEPFTFIDGVAKVEIMRSIMQYLENKTLILITKDTDLLDMFDRIYFLENGEVVESGKYSELVKKKGKFYKAMRANQ